MSIFETPDISEHPKNPGNPQNPENPGNPGHSNNSNTLEDSWGFLGILEDSLGILEDSWGFLRIPWDSLGDSWGFFEEAGPDEIIDQRLRNEIINENVDKET